jgi:retinol dehydrogenase 12
MVREMEESQGGKEVDVIVNAVNPGYAKSDLAVGLLPEWGLELMFAVLGARTTEEGSRTLVDAAAGGIGTHGAYLSNLKVTAPSRFVLSEEGKRTQRRVFEEVMARLDEIVLGVSKNF